MKEFVTKYMFQNKWTTQSKHFFEEDRCQKTLPHIKKVKNGIILPQKDGVLPWGIGAV